MKLKKINSKLLIGFLIIMLVLTHISIKLETILVPVVEVIVPTTEEIYKTIPLNTVGKDGKIIVEVEDLQDIEKTTVTLIDLVAQKEIPVETTEYNQGLLTVTSSDISSGKEYFVEIIISLGEFGSVVPQECLVNGKFYYTVEEQKDGSFTVTEESATIARESDTHLVLSGISGVKMIVKHSTQPLRNNMEVYIYEEDKE